ncbi:MAG: DUF5045 domain-containing protein [Prevotella sp.]|jgi:hypothetical protein|nr:DUF5045 domain-containing protein [Prevotella sp.]
MRRSVFILSLLATAIVSANAQSVTYNHDSSVMNQFTIGEVGLGSFTPDLYYDALHKSYRNGAMMTNKQLFRTQMHLELNKEEGHAEALDSALNERKRVEALNIADRTPGVTDVAWQVEKGKIENKLDIFKKNIERLTTEGAPAKVYIIWMERYNCLNCGLQAVRDAYMPQGKRKEQYIAIYKDILEKNTEVCEYISYLRYEKMIKRDSTKIRPLPKTKVGLIARTALGRWKIANTGVAGIDE